ncbi:nucleotide disphospho-sugar-binding domain-containing protein [Actinokineospora globicatena]|uniref:nucleotide disphospho-sugar-binding domain-containing protein n=1 Tax=Actinokineospora globicatena TaxID=103729 RepID=UPI0020A28058|nr:nucleotide disphospho-sugar-binding domain-containing protein [Actinokineospora globicatena]
MRGSVLFVTLAGAGHINPTVPVVAELGRRGHRVRYASGEVVAGVERVPLPPLPLFVPPGGELVDILGAWFLHYFAANSAVYPVLREHIAAERPDVVCYDATNWPARVIAAEFGVPAVRLVPHLASNAHFALERGLPDDHPAALALARRCASFAGAHGIDLDPSTLYDVVDEVNLVFLPREFQPAGDTFDDRFRFVGPTVRQSDEPWSPPSDKVLYVALGSVLTDVALYRQCVEAFAGTDWHLAITTGGADLGPLPPNVDARPYFPQLSVLRHASAFLTHAGMNSTMEALSHGVPLITSPRLPEQVVNAARIHELGLGVPLADPIHDTVTAVVADRTTRANLAAMRQVIHRTGGATQAANEIEARMRPALS